MSYESDFIIYISLQETLMHHTGTAAEAGCRLSTVGSTELSIVDSEHRCEESTNFSWSI